MPIITKRDGWTNLETVFSVGPDRHGVVFPINEGIPLQLDPLVEPALQIFSLRQDILQEVFFDYSQIRPERNVQILQITGCGLYRKKIYLSPDGTGSSFGLKPIPQPRPEQYTVISFAPIRPEGMYRRKRVNGRKGDEVIGWERHEDYHFRKNRCKEM